MTPPEARFPSLEPFVEDDTELLNELIAGAMYDIIDAVLAKCPDWPKAKQNAMMEIIVEAIALRWGIIDIDDAKFVELVDGNELQ